MDYCLYQSVTLRAMLAGGLSLRIKSAMTFKKPGMKGQIKTGSLRPNDESASYPQRICRQLP